MSVDNRGYASRYVYGTAAKNVQILEDPRRDPLLETEAKAKHRSRIRTRNVRRIRRLSLVLMTLAAAIMVGTCYYYLTLTAQMKQYVSDISALELKLADLQIENDYQLDMITDSIDLNEVRKVAVERLGMQEPAEGQMVGYDYSEDSYMRQYKDVAEAGQTSLLDYLN